MARRKKAHHRRAKLGTRKRKIVFLRVAFALAVMIVLLSIVVWITRLEQFTIENIEVTGNKIIQTQVIEGIVDTALSGSYFYLVPRRYAMTYPQGEITNNIYALSPRIHSVGVERNDPTSLLVRIKEREPYALWCGEKQHASSTTENCYYLDDFGFIFAKSPNFTGSVFFKYYGSISAQPASTGVNQGGVLGAQFMARDQFRGFNLFFTSFRQLGIEPIALAKLVDADVEIITSEGSRIIFNTEQNLATLLDSLESVLESPPFVERDSELLEYVDLRFGNKVFYKFKSEEERESL
jgi:hypothetical protein